MWRLTLRNTVARRARLALTLLAVLLGVTFVTGSLILTDTSRTLLDQQFRTATAGVDLTVRRAAAFDSAMGIEVARDPLPATVLDQVQALPGVADARAVARGDGLLSTAGTAIVPSGPSVLTSWTPTPFSAFTIRTGRPPTAGDEVVVDAATAAAHHVTLGDRVTVRAVDTATLRVVGLAGFGTSLGLPNSTVAIVSLPIAQRMLHLNGAVSEVAVTAADGTTVSQLRDRVNAALGSQFEVSSSQDVAAASAAAAKDQVGYLQIMLLALAAAALLVGAFLIANTFSIVITQRTRELAVLRAAGATGGQVLRSVLGEALLVGLTASIGGLGLGVLAATGLRDLAGMFGIALPPGAMVLAPRTVLIAFAVGVLITLTAAAGPARRAAQVAPVTAMRESSTPATGGGRARTAAGLVAMVLGTAALGAVLAGAGSILLLGMSAAATIAGLSLLGPVFAPVLARLVGRPLDAAGVPGRLARESAARAPRRTAATAMALALGLALISFTTVVASSVKASIRQSYGEVISADYVIESGRNEMLGGLPAHLHHHVANLPQVAVASRLRYGHWKDGQATRALTAIDPATLPQVTSLHLTAGTIGALAGGGIVLADHVAIQHHLGLGDTLVMTFARTGAQRIPIVGVLRDADAQALSTDYIISLDTYARHYTENLDASIFVKAADGVRPADATTAIRSALTDAPTAQLRDQAAAVAGRTQTLDRILGLVTALLLLTIVIALLGITNTLALSIIERTREIGLLRAVGMTRSQLRWMIRGEAVVVAALATVLGLGLGIGFAAATVAALGSTTPIAVVLPAGRLLLVVGVALAAGLLAGLLPARRAARLDVLAAISAP